MEPQDVVMGLETEYGLVSEIEGRALHPDAVQNLISQITKKGQQHEYDNPMGARIYQDSYFIEGATPECAGENAPENLALYMRATDEVILEKFYAALEDCKNNRLTAINFWKREKQTYHLLKGSADWVGKWYGRHLNIRIPKKMSSSELVAKLAPYLGTNPIWAGHGGVMPKGLGVSSEEETPMVRFIFSPRAESTTHLSSFSAMGARGLICTKSFGTEKKYDFPEWKRLHIIQGDALFSDFITFIDAGITSLIVRLIANGGFPESFPSFPADPRPEQITSILIDLHKINIDPGLNAKIGFANHVPLTALAIQKLYLELLWESEKILSLTPTDKKILAELGEILKILEKDPRALKDRCECWRMLSLYEDLLQKYGGSWETSHLKTAERKGRVSPLSRILLMLFHQSNALDKEWGIWSAIRTKSDFKTMYSRDKIDLAKTNPPDSRAALRTEVRRISKDQNKKIKAITWSTIEFTDLNGLKHLIHSDDPTGRSNEETMKLINEKLPEIAPLNS